MKKGIVYITTGAYLMEDQVTAIPAVKIGHSSTFKALTKKVCAFMGRMFHNSTYHPNSIMVAVMMLDTKSDAKIFESYLHQSLKSSHLKKEWFAKTDEVIKTINDINKIQHQQMKDGMFNKRVLSFINRRNRKVHQ